VIYDLIWDQNKSDRSGLWYVLQLLSKIMSKVGERRQLLPDRKWLIKIISTRYFLVIKEINKYLVDMILSYYFRSGILVHIFYIEDLSSSLDYGVDVAKAKTKPPRKVLHWNQQHRATTSLFETLVHPNNYIYSTRLNPNIHFHVACCGFQCNAFLKSFRGSPRSHISRKLSKTKTENPSSPYPRALY
jgi:hypothetical protein